MKALFSSFLFSLSSSHLTCAFLLPAALLSLSLWWAFLRLVQHLGQVIHTFLASPLNSPVPLSCRWRHILPLKASCVGSLFELGLWFHLALFSCWKSFSSTEEHSVEDTLNIPFRVHYRFRELVNIHRCHPVKCLSLLGTRMPKHCCLLSSHWSFLPPIAMLDGFPTVFLDQCRSGLNCLHMVIYTWEFWYLNLPGTTIISFCLIKNGLKYFYDDALALGLHYISCRT